MGNSVVVDLRANDLQLQAAFARVRGTVAGLRANFAALARSAQVVFLGLSGAITGLIALSGKQAKAEAKLAAVLKATGNAAGFTAEQLHEQATALQKVSTVGDETIINVQALLATFKQIKGDNFKEATQAALDMSAVIGQDLKGSAIQLGKALNDPIQGMSALQRVGVSFTQQQKDVVKFLQETGDVARAQKVILQELREEFGGAAEAISRTFVGSLKQTIGVLSDFGEEIGDAFIPELRKILNTLKAIAGPIATFVKSNKALVVSIGKWVAGITGAIVAIKLVTSVIGLLNIKLWATVAAQVAVLATSGPKGWLLLASSAVAMGLAVELVNEQMNRLGDFTDEATKKAKKLEKQLERKAKKDEIDVAALAKEAAAHKEAQLAAKEQEKILLNLKKASESLAQSVRLPIEVYKDSIEEFNELFNKGLISLETHVRAIKKAADELDESTVGRGRSRFVDLVQAWKDLSGTGAADVAVKKAEEQRKKQIEELRKAQKEAVLSNSIAKKLETLLISIDNKVGKSTPAVFGA